MAKVLVVDDAVLMRVRAAKVLQDDGHAPSFVLKPFPPDRVLGALQKLLAA